MVCVLSGRGLGAGKTELCLVSCPGGGQQGGQECQGLMIQEGQNVDGVLCPGGSTVSADTTLVQSRCPSSLSLPALPWDLVSCFGPLGWPPFCRTNLPAVLGSLRGVCELCVGGWGTVCLCRGQSV